MNFFLYRKVSANLKLIITLVFLLGAVACQSKTEADAKLLAADAAALAGIKKIKNNLASNQPVLRADVDLLKTLYEKYPHSTDIRQTLQTVLIKRDDWAAVEKLINEIPENETTNADRLNLAKIYLKLGQYENAAGLLRNLIGDKTIEIEAKTLLGQAQFYLGQLDEAAQTIDSIWNALVAEKKTDEMTLRGMIYFRKGNLDQSIEILKKVVEIAPENISANNTLSRAYTAKGDKANADIYLEKTQKAYASVTLAERKQIKNVAVYYQLEDAYRAKKYDEVINLVKQTLPEAEPPTKASLYQYLANAYAAQGKQTEAENALAEAAKLTVK